ncbi:MAG: tetratricopeptide repeat protein [Cyclobacteriaceae bacterium]
MTGRYAEAEPLYIQSLEINKKLFGEDDPNYAYSLESLASLYENTGRFNLAEHQYIKALEIIKKAYGEDDPDYAYSLENLAYVYESTRRYDESEQLYIQASDIYKKINGEDDSDYASSLQSLASLYEDIGRFGEAEALHLQAAEIYKTIYAKHQPEFCSSLEYLARFYETIGRFGEAEELYVQALGIYKKVYGEEHPNTAGSMDLLGFLYARMGRYVEAESLLTRALAILENYMGDVNTDDTMTSLAFLYEKTGRYTESERLLNKVIEINKETIGEDHWAHAVSLNNLASIYMFQGRYSEAEQLYFKSLSIYKESQGEEHPNYGSALNNLAYLYRFTDQYAEAIPLLIQALEIVNKAFGMEHPSYARSLFNLARMYQVVDPDNPTIEMSLKQSVAIDKKLSGNNSNYAWLDKLQLARYYYQKGRKMEALLIFQQSIDFFQNYSNAYFDNLGESEREAFYKTVKENFEEFIQVAFLEAKANPALLSEACNLQLQQKAILLNTSNQIKSRILASGDRKLISLYDEVEAIRQRLGKIQSLPPESKSSLTDEKDSLSALLTEKDKQLTEYSTFYREERTPATWEAIRDQLGEKEALVELVRFRKYDYRYSKFTDKVQYGAFIITAETQSQPDYVLFQEGNFLEEKAIKAYQNFIRSRIIDDRSYGYFWQPLKDALEGVEKVYVSPDGVFNQLNLKTLFNADTKTYLFEEVDLHLVTSGKELLTALPEPLLNRYGLLIGNPVFGEKAIQEANSERGGEISALLASVERGSGLDPLPGAEKEVSQIRELLVENGWRQQTLIGAEAQEAMLKDMLKPKVLHIATHGFFQKDVDDQINYSNNPLYRSGLLLSGSAETLYGAEDIRGNTQLGKEDGILTAFEAMNLNIDNTDLVVLSACETGLGVIRNGEGVYGLQRAFKVAGARSILMSLWKVNDQTTQELMVSFYENWFSGLSKREAFRKAQESIKSKYPDPYYWGAFVMVGE